MQTQYRRETLTSFRMSPVIGGAWILWFGATVCVVWCGAGHKELINTVTQEVYWILNLFVGQSGMTLGSYTYVSHYRYWVLYPFVGQ